MKIDAILLSIQKELIRASELHKPEFDDYHQGLDIVREEFQELEAEIRRKPQNRDHVEIEKEAIQLAAMGAKMAMLARCEIEKGRK